MKTKEVTFMLAIDANAKVAISGEYINDESPYTIKEAVNDAGLDATAMVYEVKLALPLPVPRVIRVAVGEVNPVPVTITITPEQ